MKANAKSNEKNNKPPFTDINGLVELFLEDVSDRPVPPGAEARLAEIRQAVEEGRATMEMATTIDTTTHTNINIGFDYRLEKYRGGYGTIYLDYYDNTGTWQNLQSYTGVDSWTCNVTDPLLDSWRHANFKIRFRFTSDDVNRFGGVDYVYITGDGAGGGRRGARCSACDGARGGRRGTRCCTCDGARGGRRGARSCTGDGARGGSRGA